jgi:uncharacterized protein (TIGR01777 family)
MEVAVSSSHGLIGTALVRRLEAEGHGVRRIVRGADGVIDPAPARGADAVVNLAGEGIGDHRWSAEHKRRVLDSRVIGTTRLAEALAGFEDRPRVLVSGSAVGFYGDRGDEPLTEDSPSGDGFLAEVVRRWEAATAPAEGAGARVVHARTGIVLSPEGGALKKQLLPFKLGVGGRLGAGRQWTSWISLDDEVGAILRCIEDESLRGPVNLTAPNPVTSAEFAKALGAALHRPTVLPVPGAALKLLFGAAMAEEMLLSGQRVVPAKLEAAGFAFRDPLLGPALARLLS